VDFHPKTELRQFLLLVIFTDSRFLDIKANALPPIPDPTLFSVYLRPGDAALLEGVARSKFSPTFSAIAYTVDWIATPVVSGITLASTTRTLTSPYIFSRGLTTPVSQVDQ